MLTQRNRNDQIVEIDHLNGLLEKLKQQASSCLGNGDEDNFDESQAKSAFTTCKLVVCAAKACKSNPTLERNGDRIFADILNLPKTPNKISSDHLRLFLCKLISVADRTKQEVMLQKTRYQINANLHPKRSHTSSDTRRRDLVASAKKYR